MFQDLSRLRLPDVKAAQLAETHDSLFVDEESVRNGLEPVQVAQDVRLIDQRRERYAGLFHVETRPVGRLRVHRDR